MMETQLSQRWLGRGHPDGGNGSNALTTRKVTDEFRDAGLCIEEFGKINLEMRKR